jgi:hypothetical protein
VNGDMLSRPGEGRCDPPPPPSRGVFQPGTGLWQRRVADVRNDPGQWYRWAVNRGNAGSAVKRIRRGDFGGGLEAHGRKHDGTYWVYVRAVD